MWGLQHREVVAGHLVNGDAADNGATAADKLANLRSTLDDGDPQVYARFKAGIGGFAWYHDTFGRLLVDRLGGQSLLARRLQQGLDQLAEVVALEHSRLGDAVQEMAARLGPLDLPAGSGRFTPWPWFALDAVHRAGGTLPSPQLLGDRWQSWFGLALPPEVLARLS